MLDPRAPSDEFLRQLPLPLAQLYRRAVNAKSPRDAHDFAFYLWEAAIKLLASAEIAAYRADGTPDPSIDERLKNLARPSLGHWWEFIRLLTPKLAERHEEYRPLNEALFGRVRSDLPRCVALEATLTTATGQAARSRSTVQIGELFERLIEYRNKSIGHGAPAAKTSDQIRTMADALLLAAAELFERLDLLGGRRLIVVSEVRPVRGVWLIERSELHGVVPWRIASLECPRIDGDAPPVAEGVHLADPAHADEPRGLLALEPLITYDADSETTLILNRQRRGQRVEMLCYTTGRTLEQTVVKASYVAATDDDEPAAAVMAGPATTRRIGDYDIIGELGRGAMGVVYRAWQPSLGREVALKMQPRAGDPKADARFRREIRALGRVDHPHLVKVYTSGTDGDQFYFTMELVEGAPLAAVSDALTLTDNGSTTIDLPEWKQALGEAYAAANRGGEARHEPTVTSTFSESTQSRATVPPSSLRRSRVRSADPSYIRHIAGLMRQVAEAVDALHEKGIIHRDIKPGNVLVSADGGNAVLMDLGLAQLADDFEGRLTRTRQFVGTLRYASPQQVLAAGQLDRRSDVYSLGATLWELLALRPLFGATDQTPTPQLMEMIQRNEPERLGRVNATVGRDLEAIVHKCLEKSPDARYATAAELAADLGRWLEGAPVRARPVHGWERAAKWVRRRPLLAGLALALMLALVGAVIGTSWGLVKAQKARDAETLARIEAEKQRDDANEQRRRTRAALDDMLGDEALAFLTTQRTLLPQQRAFLERALKYYIEFAGYTAQDAEGRVAAARAQSRVGRIYQVLGNLPQADASLQAAIGALEDLVRDYPTPLTYRRDLAATRIRLGNVLQDESKFAESGAQYGAAIQALGKLVEENPDEPDYRQLLGNANNNSGNQLQGLGRWDEAEKAHRKALASRQKLAAEFPSVARYQQDLGVSYNNLASLLFRTGRYTDAMAEHAAALPIRQKLVDEFPDVPLYRSDLANTHMNRANTLHLLGRNEEASRGHKLGLELMQKLAIDFPAVPDYRRDLATMHTNLGAVFADMDQLSDAEGEYRAAQALREKLVADFPAVVVYRGDLAFTQTNLGWLLTNKKDYAGAESALRSAIANFTKLAAEFPKAPKYRSSLANAHFNLGVLLGEREQFAEAERAYRRALDLQERLTREFPVNSTYAVELAKSCGEIGTLAADQGRPQEAVEIFNKAIDALETLIQRNPQQASARTALGVTYSRRAPALSQLGRHDDAMHDWDRALALCSKSNRMEVRSYRAAELVRAGRTAEAVKEGEELAATSEASRVILYRCARVFALASSDAANPAREHHAVRAVELLRAATTKGFHDFANLLRDENLAALRGRDDFAAYLWEYADTAAK